MPTIYTHTHTVLVLPLSLSIFVFFLAIWLVVRLIASTRLAFKYRGAGAQSEAGSSSRCLWHFAPLRLPCLQVDATHTLPQTASIIRAELYHHRCVCRVAHHTTSVMAGKSKKCALRRTAAPRGPSVVWREALKIKQPTKAFRKSGFNPWR